MAVQIPFPLPSEGYALNSKVRINLDFLVDQFNQFNSGTATWDNVSVGTANSLTGTITLYNASNANYLTIKPGVTAASITYTLPTAAPSVGTTGILSSTSAGVMSWVNTSSLISGTANQVIVTDDGDGTVTLSTPQSIGTGSSPTFAGLTVSGLSNNYLTWTNAGVLTGLSNSQGTTAMLIGSTGGTPKYVKLLGTSNQITVTFNTDDTTLSLPQSIATSSDVQFGTVKTGAGTITNTALKLNANNTGIYMSSATEMDFVIGGVVYGVLDTSGNWFATNGETRADVIRGLSSLKVGGTVGSIVTIVSGAVANYTLTLPTTDGNANEVLLTDGAGNLSWSSVTGAAGAATKALDNLASVAINTTLVSDTDNTDDLGTTAIGWRSLYLGTSIKSGATTLATTTELGYLTGVTSAIQTQIDSKSPTAGSTSLITLGTVTTGTWSATTIAVNKGGTGQTTYTDGQLLIGNSTGNTLTKATLTGTSNQITVTNGGGSITLSTPQNIHTAATPTFSSLTLSAISNQLVLGTTRTATITAPTPATSSRTYTFPDMTADYSVVATEGAQTINGAKTFSGNILGSSNVTAGTSNVKTRLTLVDASSASTTVGSNPIIWISGGNASNSTLSEIGFTYGFTGAFSETYAPATMGYQLTSGSGFTKGDLVFATRNVTTDTVASERMRITAAGNVVVGTAALSTSATDGFIYVDTCAGAPSGAPTTYTGRCALVYDTTNNKLYIYNGAWKSVTLA